MQSDFDPSEWLITADSTLTADLPKNFTNCREEVNPMSCSGPKPVVCDNPGNQTTK